MLVKHSFYRDTWAEVDLDSIAYNIRQLRGKLLEDTKIIAVVKADAYGHGYAQVARTALESGADSLAVALLEEALSLREAGIDAPILVLGWVPSRGALIASEYNISLTFYQKEWIEEVNTYSFEKDLNLHMKWDTGMGRSGIRSKQELEVLLQLLNKNRHIHLEGVYTHFASADVDNLTQYHEQSERFEDLLRSFTDQWDEDVCIHLGNSAASIRFPSDMHDAVRFGIGMYGLYPGQAVKEEASIDLKQAFSLHSRLVHVKRIRAGETVGYGATYKAAKDEWIGTVLIGYGDGWNRRLQGFSVLVDGKRMPIVGRICMDQMMVRLDKKYEVGTTVTLIGSQGNEVISMDEVADYLGTINYEIPCMINNRVPRVYTESKKI